MHFSGHFVILVPKRVEFRFFIIPLEAHWLSNHKKPLKGYNTTLFIQKSCFGTDIRALGRLKMASKLTKCLSQTC